MAMNGSTGGWHEVPLQMLAPTTAPMAAPTPIPIKMRRGVRCAGCGTAALWSNARVVTDVVLVAEVASDGAWFGV